MIIPYKVDILTTRWPVSNYVIMGLTALIFVFQSAYPEKFACFVCNNWSIESLTGYMWLHKDLFHIIINLVFLWVFGNAVCSKISNICYPFAYVILGVAAAVVNLLFDGPSIVGASGAIFGIIGMYLVLYPFDSIKCVFVFIPIIKRFRIAGLWIILWWVLLNLLGAWFFAYRSVGYVAHLSGFFTGVILGVILIKLKFIERDSTDEALFRLLRH